MDITGFPTAAWRKATYSGNSTDCVEVARSGNAVGLRDTKDRDGGALTVQGTVWAGLRGTLSSSR